MSNASVDRLWSFALKRAGTAVKDDPPTPELPTLKMRDLAFALLHFIELLEGLVPPPLRPVWKAELALTREHLDAPAYRESLNERVFAPIETSASWPNLMLAVRGAGLRALYAPGLAGVAQRAVVGIAFTLLRDAAPSRADANALIRVGLERLVAGLWLASARQRLGDDAHEVTRAWWGAPGLALFQTAREWWLVRLTPGRPIKVERGGRDDVLATVPDAHFARAVATVMRELG